MRVSSWRVFSSLIAGMPFLHAPLPLHGQAAQPPLWTLTREARFGGTGDSLTDLIQPQVAVIAPDGNSLVFDYRTREIKVYDPAGKYLRRVGRRGQGPGEYGRVGTMGYLAIPCGSRTRSSGGSRSSLWGQGSRRRFRSGMNRA